MKISLTAGELISKGIWDEVCELKGLNIWAVNEGLMDRGEEINFNEEEAKQLGILHEKQYG